MINIDNTHIYEGISFSPFRLSSTNFKLGITNTTPLTRISSSRFRKDYGKDGENLCEALLLSPK
jgi:hypothetical protein